MKSKRMQHALLEAEALTVRYGDLTVLNDVSLSVNEAEILTLVGPNGSGKTSLLRALLGLVPLASGRVLRNEGLRVGYVPQKLALEPSLPLRVHRFLALSRDVTAAEIERVLERVGAPDIGHLPLQTLSGGQMQRVLLARAMLGEPHLLMLDEPTSALDQPGVAEFYRLIEELREALGVGVLMVGHDLHVVMSAADRVICLNGHICCEGTPHIVREAPEYRALFGLGTGGRFALYPHMHDHSHDHIAHTQTHGASGEEKALP